MASTQGMTVSQILRSRSELDEEPKKKSREDWRKAKELEEARKAGTAPAAVDETGKDINPHIPQYISSAPWYYGAAGPTLKHQRPQEEKQANYSNLNEWYKRGVDTTKVSIKFRKGACENCGAMTHKKKECMERPRKVGAKFSGANIAVDEFVQDKLLLSYDGKRDRWSGYDPSEHKAIIEEFQKVEEAKRHLRADKLNANEETNEEDVEEEDEDKYVDEVDMPGTKVDSKQRITVRNLRIREDTAKYLRNLDPNSAYYDPKTRSMRENPNPQKDSDYTGENFVRFSGDIQKHAKAQLFAWEAYEKGVDVHALGEPTKLELLQKEYEEKKDQFKSQIQKVVLEKYGGEEHLKVPPKSLIFAQTEDYVEYSRSGKVIKGAEKPIIKSRYDEDVYLNNHTSVWGSYWRGGDWGYKCCHSMIKNSYCVGESGKVAAAATSLVVPVTTKAKASASSSKQKSSSSSSSSSNSSSSGSDSSNSSSSSSSEEDSSSSDEEEKKAKKRMKKKNKKRKLKQKKKDGKKQKCEDSLKEALKAEEEQKTEAERLLRLDERKRPYNSMYEVKEPTEAEMEAYLMKRKREEDPMNQFM